MMDAVMYGIIPIDKMEKFCKAPPPNVFKKPNTFAGPIKSMASLLVNGTGINVPIRNITSINNVKTILFLISATRMKFEIVRNIKSPLFFRLLPRTLLLLQLKTYVPQQLVFSQQFYFLKLSHLISLY